MKNTDRRYHTETDNTMTKALKQRKENNSLYVYIKNTLSNTNPIDKKSAVLFILYNWLLTVSFLKIQELK